MEPTSLITPQLLFLSFTSPEYLSRYRILEASLKEHQPEDCSIVHFIDGPPEGGTSYIPGFHKEKYKEILRLIETENKPVVFLGADTQLFSPLDEMRSLLLGTPVSPYNKSFLIGHKDVVLVPHVKAPVADRSYMKQLYGTGHVNSDIIGFNNTHGAKEILRWLISVVEDDTTGGAFYDQTWLSALPFLFSGVEVLRHRGYNVGYWEDELRLVQNENTKEVLTFTLDPVRIIQWSGFQKGMTPKLSRHSEKEASGVLLKLLEEYNGKI